MNLGSIKILKDCLNGFGDSDGPFNIIFIPQRFYLILLNLESKFFGYSCYWHEIGSCKYNIRKDIEVF